MKKLIPWLAAAIFTAMIFCGCGETEAVKLEAPYSCSITVTTPETEYKGTLQRNAETWEFSYSEPEEVEGLSIVCQDKSYKVSIGDVEFEGDRDSLPDSAVSTMIIAALDSASLDAEVKYTTENGKVVARGTAGDAAFTVEFKNDAPVCLTIGDVKVDFTDFKSL